MRAVMRRLGWPEKDWSWGTMPPGLYLRGAYLPLEAPRKAGPWLVQCWRAAEGAVAAGLKVWRDSQWIGVLAMGSVKWEVLFGLMMGALVGRVKGPSCQLDEVGLAAARRAMLRSVAEMRGDLLVRMRLPVSFIM